MLLIARAYRMVSPVLDTTSSRLTIDIQFIGRFSLAKAKGKAYAAEQDGCTEVASGAARRQVIRVWWGPRALNYLNVPL